MKQLDLFTSPSAKVFLFPLHRRVQFVAAVAHKIEMARSKRARQAYWNKLLADLRNSMRAGGCSDAEINDDLARFWDAVDHKLRRTRNVTGGAA